MSNGISGIHIPDGKNNDEWLTPPNILADLGPFDLDPCAPITRPWATAANHFTIQDNGLALPWSGRVWCNPPYGRETGKWLKKCAKHKNATALIFARTETKMFHQHVWSCATALLFLYGRLTFLDVTGIPAKYNSGGPSVLIAYDNYNASRLLASGLKGKFVWL